MASKRDTALALAARGFAVFPIAEGRKDRPLIKAWQRRASTDPQRLKRWWARFPRANVGVAAGLSHLVVIDLDRKNGHDGPASWAALCREHGIHAQTVTVRTPSGGLHLWYQAPLGTELGPTAGLLGDGIDTRAGPGYVLVPPSSTSAGHYTWGAGSHIAPLPDALRELLEADAQSPCTGTSDPHEVHDLSRYVEQALRVEAIRVSGAPVGQRNHELNRAAFALGTLAGASWAELETGLVENTLLRAASVCGLPDWEAKRTIASGLSAGMQRPRPEPAGG